MEALTKTVEQILFEDWPRKIDGSPSILDSKIQSWLHGERSVIGENKLPAIVVDSKEISYSWSATSMQEKEYQISINCYHRVDNPAYSTSFIHEFQRLLERVWRNNVHFWIFERCFFDMNPMIDPQDLVDINTNAGTFQGALTPWVADVTSDFTSEWNACHQSYSGGSSPTVPTIPDNYLYAAAYLKLYNEIDDGDLSTSPWDTSITFLSDSGKSISMTVGNIIRAYREDEIVPVRYVSDSRITSSKFSNKEVDSVLLRSCETSIYAKEQELVPILGPK